MQERRIWKYPLTITDTQDFAMPAGASILTVQVQDEHPCIWALVDPKAESVIRRITIIGTGHSITEYPGEYAGTFQINGGRLVFHVFDQPAY